MSTIRIVLVLTAMMDSVAATALAQPGPTQAELNAASTNTTDWLMTRHGYNAQRYVDLDQINRENVASLRPVCIYQTAFTGSFNTNPVIYRGVMYLTAGTSTMAVDATTCRLEVASRVAHEGQGQQPTGCEGGSARSSSTTARRSGASISSRRPASPDPRPGRTPNTS